MATRAVSGFVVLFDGTREAHRAFRLEVDLDAATAAVWVGPPRGPADEPVPVTGEGAVDLVADFIALTLDAEPDALPA